MKNKIAKFIKNPGLLFIFLSDKGYLNWLPDSIYLRIVYFTCFRKRLNLANPQTFNEKLQWLKLYNRNPLYTTLVDKYAVKKWVADKIGQEYIIPTLGVWDKVEDIDFDKLPNQFVLKCTHDSGSIVICRDKNNFNKKEAIKKLTRGLKHSGYYYGREWPYKNVPPKIIAEQYMQDDAKSELIDYKFFCFNGNADNVMVCIDRNIGEPKFYFFNKNWELLRLNKRGKAAPNNFTLDKPILMDKMFELAGILSQNIPFVRVDLYYCNDQIYFGEMTFFPQSGFDKNLLPETDIYLGQKLFLHSK